MSEATVDPQLTEKTPKPRGVLNPRMKFWVYLGAVVVLVAAMLFGDTKKKPAAKTTAASAPPPVMQDNTASNAAALTSQLHDEKQQVAPAPLPSPAAGTTAQQGAAMAYGPNGLPIGQGASTGQGAQVQTGTSAGAGQVSPAEQEAQQIAARDRERQYASRFESNLVYSAVALPASRPQQQSGSDAASPAPSQPTNLTIPRLPGEPPAEAPAAQEAPAKRPAEVNIDSAAGSPYVVYEGATLDTVLMNRLDGDSVGPVKVLVSDPLYSHDHQHVLVPEGTVILGEARKIGSSGFGQQRRIAVVFHRMIMPDGYSVDLDQFHGLDQIGEEALKDKVNNHYLQIFGTSIALGVISGAAQITQGGSTLNSNGSQAFTNGAASGISQQATTVLDKFIQIPPTITIREGHRVKVYIAQDMLLPAWENHNIPQSF